MSKSTVEANGQGQQQQAYSREQLHEWYNTMMLQRRFEERAAMMYGQQKIRGFCHLYIGQEGVSSGVQTAMRKDDYVITAYRDHGQALACGISPEAVMAELFGKRTGCVKGKGGSMHMFSTERNFLGGHGIVGQHIPLGAGIGFAIQYRQEDKVCVCLFGDGAIRQGAVHETFNMAMMWNLPVVFIVENNQYAMGTSVERSGYIQELYKFGQCHEMPAEPVDGMDVMAVYEATSEAIQAARDGNGPTLLETKTYRYRGHSISDPALYRTKDELEYYKDIDPILRLKSYILEHEMGTEEELKQVDTEAKERVKAAIQFADESPEPDPSELYEDVYVGDYPFIRE
jgi:pyruvate dehydrogenase E1 component alpha subunit